MTTPTQYSIVGSGNLGSALAQLFARAAIAVSIANTRGPESIRDLAAALRPHVQPVPLAEALASEVILMAVRFEAIQTFGASLADWTGKTVVDSTNASHAPGWEAMIQGRPSTQYAAAHLPGAQVVKAFNQLPANTLQAELDPTVGRRVIFVATDVPEAGDRIADLVRALGLAPVQLGRTDEGGLLIQTPHALVLRHLIERPLF